MCLQWALDVVILSIFNIFLMRLYIDLDLPCDESELTVNHSNEVLDTVLVNFLVMNYDFYLIARRSSTNNNTQAYIWSVRWFCIVSFLCMCMEDARFSGFYIVLSPWYKRTYEFFTFLLSFAPEF